MASAENRYRKIELRMWADQKFRELSPLPPSGQSLWLYLIAGPHTSIIPGLSKATRGGFVDELAWTPEAFDAAFSEVASRGMVEADWKANVVWIPNAIKCNLPQSPNVIKAWRKEWPLIPDCGLKIRAGEAMRSAVYAMGEGFQKAFEGAFLGVSSKPSRKSYRKPSPKTMPIQEQEQLTGTGTENREQKTTANEAPDFSKIDPPEKKKPKATASSSTVPDWIPADAWADFVEMRKRVRAPMTERAMQLMIGNLEKLRSQGEDVRAVLDQSTANAWKSVFPTKRKPTASSHHVGFEQRDYTAGLKANGDGTFQL